MAVIKQKTTPKAIDPIANPNIAIPIYSAKLKPIKKYIVCFGQLLVQRINPTDKAEEKIIIPTIGPASLAMIYPNPVLVWPD